MIEGQEMSLDELKSEMFTSLRDSGAVDSIKVLFLDLIILFNVFSGTNSITISTKTPWIFQRLHCSRERGVDGS